MSEPFLQIMKPENCNTTLSFFYKTEKLDCKKNQKFLQNYMDGFYIKNPIEYTINKFGYRSKYSNIPNTDYILVLGCSHTFGLGLHEEHRYSNLLEDSYNIPVINISFPGGSPNLVRDNIFQLFVSGHRLPKLVVIQWPNEHRLTIGRETYGPWTKIYIGRKSLRYFSEYSALAKYQSNKLLSKFKVPLIEFDIHDNQNFVIDVARDRDHPGIDSNKKICEYLIGEINDLHTFT